MARIYLAGPMRGVKDFNFPAFDEAAKELRQMGYTVFSPAEKDREKYGEAIHKGIGDLAEFTRKTGATCRDFARIDLNWIIDYADIVCCLRGWERSTGAKAEIATARWINARVYAQELNGKWLEIRENGSITGAELPDLTVPIYEKPVTEVYKMVEAGNTA